MKYLILCFLFSSMTLLSQEITPNGGGEYNFPTQKQCLSQEKRASIQRKLEKKKIEFLNQGLWKKEERKQKPAFAWPVKKADNLDFNECYFISNYVDHNPTATGDQYGPSNEDYNCGNRSYDTEEGYNHSGIDIASWPFQWYLYKNDLVEIVAAEDGIIYGKEDGNKDDNCSCSGNWNAVYILHQDGSYAWYGHLKKNKLTDKRVGEHVQKGEYLGVMASSGCSTGSHLHFEVYDAENNLIDPFAGECNNLNQESWWSDQGDYREPTLNALLTHDDDPVFDCPGAGEETNFSNIFAPQQRVYMALYFRDQMVGDRIQLTVYRTDNSVWQNWSFTFDANYDASYWYWFRTLPEDAPLGEWTIEAMFNGQVHKHTFQVQVDEDGDGFHTGEDCDDTDFSINPAAEEIPNNGIDENCDGIDDLTSSTDDSFVNFLDIYPNPSKDWIFVNGNKEKQRFVLSILDVEGTEIYKCESCNEINISNLSSGLYMVRIEDSLNRPYFKKIVKY